MKKVTLVSADGSDWLFIDGKKLDMNRSMAVSDVLMVLAEAGIIKTELITVDLDGSTGECLWNVPPTLEEFTAQIEKDASVITTQEDVSPALIQTIYVL